MGGVRVGHSRIFGTEQDAGRIRSPMDWPKEESLGDFVVRLVRYTTPSWSPKSVLDQEKRNVSRRVLDCHADGLSFWHSIPFVQ